MAINYTTALQKSQTDLSLSILQSDFNNPRMSTIRERITEARKAARLTQRDLAYEIGSIKGGTLTAGAVSGWESVRGVVPSVENLAAISVACNVNFEWLATGRGPRDYEEPGPDEYAVPPRVADGRVPSYALDFHGTTEDELTQAVRRLKPRQRKALARFIKEFTKDKGAG
jgi:transcriptional regulator with XRE-family HTH domain